MDAKQRANHLEAEETGQARPEEKGKAEEAGKGGKRRQEGGEDKEKGSRKGSNWRRPEAT